MTDLAEFVASMPKAELHVHHLGATPADALARLAERYPEQGLPADPERLAARLAITDLPSFFRAYRCVVELIRAPEDVYETILAAGRVIALDQVRYAEVTCSPFSSVSRGVPVPAYVEALVAAGAEVARRWGVELRWIFDIPRPDEEAARITLDAALRHGPPELVALGLAGIEAAPGRFAPHFALARANGLRLVPHAGEAAGPESIWEAIRELRPDRLGHATSAGQDPRLLDHLAARELPVEVCLTSNLVTGCVRAGVPHPAREMYRAGVTISINTDDPALFGCDLSGEYLRAARLLELDADGVTGLAMDAVRASFAPYEVRQRLLRALDEHRGRGNGTRACSI